MAGWNVDIRYSHIYTVDGVQAPNKGTTNGIRRSNFTANATNNIRFAHILDDHQAGLDMLVGIVWMPSNANAGNVLFRIGAKFLEIGDVSTVAFTTTDILEVAPGVADEIMVTVATIPGNLIPSPGIIPLQISRIGGDAQDTYAGISRILGVAILENKLPKRS